MLFAKYYEIFVRYIQLSIMVDDFYNQESIDEKYNEAPIRAFLEGLDKDVLRIMAVINVVGNQFDNEIVRGEDEYATYQHYENERFDCGTSKDKYISHIMYECWEYGRAFNFIRGLYIEH